MVKVGCLVIATTLPKKEGVLVKTLRSLDEADKKANLFHKKVLSVDDFGGNKIDFDIFKKDGWEVKIEPRGGEVLNQKRGLTLLGDCDYIYFSNDDNFIKEIPTKSDIERLDAHLVDGKKCGYLDLTFKGYLDNSALLSRFVLNKANQIDADGDNVFIIKDDSVINTAPNFIHFPIMIMPREVMSGIIEYGIKNFNNVAIEPGYGMAYDALGFRNKYYQASFNIDPALIEAEMKAVKVKKLFEKTYAHFSLLGDYRAHHIKGGHHF